MTVETNEDTRGRKVKERWVKANSKTKCNRMKDMTQGQRPTSQLSAEGNTAKSQSQQALSPLGSGKLGNVLDCVTFVLKAGVGDQGLDRVI